MWAEIQWKRNPFRKWKFKQYPVSPNSHPPVTTQHNVHGVCSRHTVVRSLSGWKRCCRVTALGNDSARRYTFSTCEIHSSCEWKGYFLWKWISLHNWCAIMTSAAFGRFWAYSQQILSTFCHSPPPLLSSSSFSFHSMSVLSAFDSLSTNNTPNRCILPFKYPIFHLLYGATLLLRFHLVRMLRLNRIESIFFCFLWPLLWMRRWVEESIVCCIVRLCY